MKPADLAHIQVPESLSLSPDGRAVVFALKTIDLERDTYVSQLWRMPADGVQPMARLTRGDNDSDPRISPDMRWIAFRRAIDEAPPQLYLIPFDGGEPWAITTREQHPLGVGALAWSPGSTQIAYTAAVPEQGRYGTVEKRTAAKEAPRRITTLEYRLDGQGYKIDRRAQVFVVDPLLASPEPRRLTTGDFDSKNVAWSPDGQSLAFVSARHEARHRTLTTDVFIMSVHDAETTQLTDTSLLCDWPVFSSDGTVVFFAGSQLGDDGVDWFAHHTSAYVIPADGSGPAVCLSDPDRHTLDGYFGRGPNGVLFTNQNRGAVEVLEFRADQAEPGTLLSGRRHVTAVDFAADRLAAVVGDPKSFGEIVIRDSTGERTITSFGDQWAATCAAFGMDEIETHAPDGCPVHGWVVRPDGVGPHPVLLMIHGGPFAQFTWRLFDEAQVYAGAGYAVVLGNPRGSSGYGFAHGRHIVADVGAQSAADLLALLDHALEDPALDNDRVGVLGGSHGGYMTTWLLAHTGRFFAGVSERSVNAIDSFLGTSDVGWLFTSVYGDDSANQYRQSPLSHAQKINTPLLVIHSENDLRAPFEQAQRLFHALKSREATVEMLVFPGEGHEMSRSGLPSHRLARFEAILEWFARHKPPSEQRVTSGT